MKNPAIVVLAFALTSCGAPPDRLTDQQVNAAKGPATGTPGDTDSAPASSVPVPGAPRSGEKVLYKALGNEPGWALTVHSERIDYLGNYGEVRFSEPTPVGFHPGVGNFATRRLKVAIGPGPCSDGMSDLVYRHTVRILADNQPFSGCGGGTVAPNSVKNTSWTVVAINGRRTGGGANYYVQFAGNDIRAKFGCNSIGGTHRQNGDHISTENLAQTLMGCPEPAATFEREGIAILGSNMRFEATSGTNARFVSEAGTIDVERAI